MDKKIELLYKFFGFSNFRYPQEEIITSILNGNDTLSILPTGAGKSLTYQLPSLIFSGLTIVISPLISLMKDQVDNLKKRGIKGAFYNSTLDYFMKEEMLSDLENGQIRLLYIAPEKLKDSKLLHILKNIKISFIVLDEAHTLMWHLDFRQSFLDIKPFIASLKIRPVISAVTATANQKTVHEIIKTLGMIDPQVFMTSFDRKNLYYSVVKSTNKNKFILKYIKKNADKCGIIYALTRKKVMEIYNFLIDNQIDATFYHGGLETEMKTQNQENFIKENVKIIVCTISFALGIDKPDIRYVINYNMPSSLEDLSQMSGRCSRDGLYGECIVLYSRNDISISEYFIDNIENANVNKRELRAIKQYRLSQLSSIIAYCNSSQCLHKQMCLYFGEKIDNCFNCKNCKKKRSIKST